MVPGGRIEDLFVKTSKGGGWLVTVYAFVRGLTPDWETFQHVDRPGSQFVFAIFMDAVNKYHTVSVIGDHKR